MELSKVEPLKLDDVEKIEKELNLPNNPKKRKADPSSGSSK